MAIVEPVLIDLSGQNQDLEVNNQNLMFGEWSKEATWVANRLIDSDEYDIVEKDKIRSAVKEATIEAYDDISDAAPSVIEEIVGLTSSVAREASSRIPVVMSKNDVLILASNASGILLLISESKEEINDITSEWASELESIADVTSDFGIELVGIIRGKDLMEQQIDRIDGELLDNESEINGLEEEVAEVIQNQMTSCFNTNVELQFNEDIYSDSFEFDLLFSPSPESLIMIEVKDGVYDEKEFDKSELVRKQDEKVRLLDEKSNIERVEGFVVIRDLDEHKFNEFSGMADRSEIQLIKYNEGEFLDNISSLVDKTLIYEATGSGSSVIHRRVMRK